ncbi:uncharacterized protein METZ01_LOCUS99984 [marine metagenome]|uniref:Uncharacterized protein n=1 Tax=marine metagenome TaxID=408172 RepID=A0A381W3M3_9ZZZZ
MHWNIIFGIFVVLSACGDLVKESDTSACNSAIDDRNYDKALSVCTSRKDKASAYMGKAGYDIINLLKSSGSSVTAYTAPSDVDLGTDDSSPASILNILQLSVAKISDNDTRATAISSSKTNLDSAYKLLQPSLGDNSSSPLTTDEILLNTFAISFAMQLNQIILFDNKTTSTSTVPLDVSGDLKCTLVSGYDNNDAKALLIAMDGHIWAAERNGMQCARVLNAYNAASDKPAAASALADWVSETADGTKEVKLPAPFYDAVCPSFESLTDYLTDLAANIEKISLSGDNTKAITNAKTSTETLMKTIGCF